jgi:hypothetical protein
MLTRRNLIRLGAVTAAAGLVSGRRAGAEEQEVRILVPAYFYPGGSGRAEWDRMTAAASRAPIVAIANPGTGPGTRVDANYREVIDRGIAAGLTLIGYVNTDYARRERAEVEADVREWVRLYPRIQGIFFDLQPSAPEHVGYYKALAAFVRTQVSRALVITNPGTDSAEEYAAEGAADVICVFENFQGFGDFRSARWMQKYPPNRFAALPYRVPNATQMRETVDHAVANQIGYLYVTDAEGENPWARLPTYWEDEVEVVRALNRRDTRRAAVPSRRIPSSSRQV